MLRIPTPAVPDDEEIEKEPSNNNNNNAIQSTSTFQKSSNLIMNDDNNSTINSSRPQPTMSYLSKMVSSSSSAPSSRRPWPPQRMSQSSGHFNVDLPRSYAETELHKLAHSQDSQSMHSSTIDHQSLMDALNSDSDQERRQHYHQRRKRSVVGQEQQGGGEGSQYSTTTIDDDDDDDDSFDRDSIELAVSSGSNDNENGRINNSSTINSSNDGDDDDIMVENVGSETLMAILEGQKDLEQEMRAIEQQENDNEEYHENNNDDERNNEEETEEKSGEFEMPNFIRVLYMGSASKKDKKLFLKKLSQAFATLFYYDTPSWLRNPKMFKERKYHLLQMSLLPPNIYGEELQDNLIDTCEDNGLSIIEADFTWSTTVAMETQHHLTSMIEQYIWLQCESARQDLMSLKKKTSPIYNHHDHRKNSSSDKFDGFVYPDKAPNGIDLCVYFYNGSNTDDKKKNRIDEDLAILWSLKKLGIPIMPILSQGANAATTTSLPSSSSRTSNSRSQYQFHHYHQLPSRPLSSSSTTTTNISTTSSPLITPTTTFNTSPTIDEQRTQFANLLAQYKIRCIDLSLAKLDVGRPPSFQKRRSSCYYPPASTNNNTIAHELEERLGKDWAASSMTSPAPYQILTIDQFATLDHQIVFSILKQSRQKAVKREKVLSAIQKEEEEEHQRQSAITTMQNYNNNNNNNRVMSSLTNDSSSSWIITSVGDVLMNPYARMLQHLQNRFFAPLFIILMIIGAILILLHFPSSSLLQKTDIVKKYGDTPWNLTAVIGMTTSQDDDGLLQQSLLFIVELGDDKKREKGEGNAQQRLSLLTPSSSKGDNTNRYECKIALPSYISQAPTSPLAKLDIQFPYPVNFTQVDFQCPLMSLSEWQDSLEKANKKSHSTVTTGDTMKARSSSSDSSNIINGDEQRQKTSRPKTRGGYWEHIYHTTNYLLHHQTKILSLVFNS